VIQAQHKINKHRNPKKTRNHLPNEIKEKGDVKSYFKFNKHFSQNHISKINSKPKDRNCME